MHSTVAPASRRTAMPRRVGIDGASAGRSTPFSIPNAACAATTDAPVCPALTTAAAARSRTSSVATRIDARGLRRSAERRRLVHRRRRRAPSTTWTSSAPASACRVSSAAIASGRPTRSRHARVPRRRQRPVHDRAPGRDRRPWRPRRFAAAGGRVAHDGPRDEAVRRARGQRPTPPRPRGPVVGCRGRSTRTRGAAPSARRTAGRPRPWWPAARRACAACGRGSWSVVVLD